MKKLIDDKEEREYKFTQEQRDEFKVPFACHACNTLMYNWDRRWFYRRGVCASCSINYIEDRDLPEELLKNRPKLLEYVKEKIEERNKKE